MESKAHFHLVFHKHWAVATEAMVIWRTMVNKGHCNDQQTQAMIHVHFYTDRAYSLPSRPHQECSAAKRTLPPVGTCVSPGGFSMLLFSERTFPLAAFAPGFLSLSPAHLLQETILRMFLSVRLSETKISVLMTSSSSPAEPEASLIPPANTVKYLPFDICISKWSRNMYIYIFSKEYLVVYVDKNTSCLQSRSSLLLSKVV